MTYQFLALGDRPTETLCRLAVRMTVVASAAVVTAVVMVAVSASLTAFAPDAISPLNTVVFVAGLAAVVASVLVVVHQVSATSDDTPGEVVLHLRPRDAVVLLAVSMFLLLLAMLGAYAAVDAVTNLERVTTWLVALPILGVASLGAANWLGRRMLTVPREVGAAANGG
jgi:hypothetical protein